MTTNHLEKPHIRPFHAIPVKKEGQQLIALRDPIGLHEQSIMVPPQVAKLTNLFNGERTIEEISKISGLDSEKIKKLIGRLDSFGLLWGPTASTLEDKLIEKLTNLGSIPPRISKQLEKYAVDPREKFEEWFQQADDPNFTEPPKGIICPWLEYEHMWEVQAGAFYAWKKTEKPDRIIVIGTNPGAIGDGCSVSPFGIETPLGTSLPDHVIIDELKKNIGKPIFVDQLDFVSDPCIESIIPWVQSCFKNTPIVPVLVPDTQKKLIVDDGTRIDRTNFIKYLKEALNNIGGHSLFVGAVNLSHIGPRFGEPRPIDEQRKKEINTQDRELLSKYIDGDVSTFLGAIDWTKNSTRWPGTGVMAAMLELLAPCEIELIDYSQFITDNKSALVSGASIAFI